MRKTTSGYPAQSNAWAFSPALGCHISSIRKSKLCGPSQSLRFSSCRASFAHPKMTPAEFSLLPILLLPKVLPTKCLTQPTVHPAASEPSLYPSELSTVFSFLLTFICAADTWTGALCPVQLCIYWLFLSHCLLQLAQPATPLFDFS